MVVNQHIPAPQLSKVSYLHPSNSVKPNLTNRNFRNDAANDKLLTSKIPNPKEKLPLIKSGIKNINIHPTMTRVPVYNTAATRTNTTRMVKVKEPQIETMASSTETESSGVFSETDNRKSKPNPKQLSRSTVRPPQPQLSSRASSSTVSACIKPVLKTVKRPNTDQFLLTDLRNEILALKTQQRDHLDQLRHELSEQFKNEMAAVVAEKESQFQSQMGVKELAWRTELNELVERERIECARQVEERERQWEVERSEERNAWQQRIDSLVQEVAQLIRERDKLEKSIREEVENRVQATHQRYASLQKETTSLQAVYELRCEEVRTLRQEVERASSLAAEVLTLRERNHTLNNTVEGLQAQLELKASEERRLQAEIATLTGHYREEILKSRRLSMERDELQYKLSIQSESIAHEADRSPTKSAETPKLPRKTLPVLHLSPIRTDCPEQENNNNSNNNTVATNTSPRLSIDDEVFHSTPAKEAANSAPHSPTSPTVRDFMEKNDSVAYVLDLGEHPAATPARTLLIPPASPWQRRRNLLRFSSLRWHKSCPQ